MDYAHRKRRSLTWLLSSFLAFSTVGALLGALAFNAAGAAVAVPAFLAPSIAGVVLIARAYHEGRIAERPISAPSATP